MYLDRTDARGDSWAIVLAGGDGTRLRSLTDDGAGNAVPKQFCSFVGGASLLAQAFTRAHAVIGRERTTTIVSAAHARYWQSLQRTLPADNLVVQPTNRGTGIGLLLPALRIVERDPAARILIVPSDHYVEDESALAVAARLALQEVQKPHARGIALLGLAADVPDTELGYIVPGRAHGAFFDVERFLEKPSHDEAGRLVRRGALWNSFILACRAHCLIELFVTRCPEVVEALRATDLHDYAAIVRIYEQLPQLDFSRDIVIGQEGRLAVMPVPHCGWSDLGTPERLAEALAHCAPPSAVAATSSNAVESPVNLALRLRQREEKATRESVGGRESVGSRESVGARG